jgi:hypothetical protein
MVEHRKLAPRGLTVAAACIAGTVLASCAWSGAHAQSLQAPTGHRQPTTADLPRDSSQKDARKSPEDIALERALNNICRGCSPIIPVSNVPRYDLARSCPAPSGQDSDSCRKDEQSARDTLNQQWTQFTAKGRSDCVQTAEIGGRPSYVQLLICLRATQIAPSLGDGR